MDDLSVEGLDSESDLTDQLILQAGAADEEAIIDAELPDSYEPYDGGGFQNVAQAGRVFKMDGVTSDTGAAAAGSTRVGLLPKIGRQQVPVVPKLAAAAPPAPLLIADEQVEEEGEEKADDLLPEEDRALIASDMPVFRPEIEDLDDDLMAALSEGVREVATHAPVLAPAPVPPPGSVPDNTPVPEKTAASRMPFPPVFEGAMLSLPKLPPGVVAMRPGAAPAAACWVCSLDDATDDVFFSVLRDLSGDLHLSQATLLPIHGGTPRAAAMKPVVAAAFPALRISTTHQLQYREASQTVFLYVSSRLYSHGETHGLLLAGAVKSGDRVAVRRLCLFDPSLLLG